MSAEFKEDSRRLMRRVQGYHDLRLDGIGDLLHRARGASVFDIGCNRGLAGFEFAYNGADRVMGCDYYEDGIITCRHLFADLRAVKSRFEVVDLTGGEAALRKAFGSDTDLKHDIVLMLATYHKLIRSMPTAARESPAARRRRVRGARGRAGGGSAGARRSRFGPESKGREPSRCRSFPPSAGFRTCGQ